MAMTATIRFQFKLKCVFGDGFSVSVFFFVHSFVHCFLAKIEFYRRQQLDMVNQVSEFFILKMKWAQTKTNRERQSERKKKLKIMLQWSHSVSIEKCHDLVVCMTISSASPGKFFVFFLSCLTYDDDENVTLVGAESFCLKKKHSFIHRIQKIQFIQRESTERDQREKKKMLFYIIWYSWVVWWCLSEKLLH